MAGITAKVAQVDSEVDYDQSATQTRTVNPAEYGSGEEFVEEVTGVGGTESSENGEELNEAEEAENHQPLSYTAIPDAIGKDEDGESGEATESSEFETVEGWDESSLTEAADPAAQESEPLVEAYYADTENAEGGQEFFGAIVGLLGPVLKTVLPSLASTAVQALAGAVTKQVGGNAGKLATRHRNLLTRLGRIGMPLQSSLVKTAAGMIKGRETDQEFDSEATGLDEAALNDLERQIETLEVVIGKDDRTQITKTTVNPWNRICHLKIKTANGKSYLGTGFFIGPRTIITAGHCVYIHGQGGWAKEIVVTPGRNGAETPFGSFTATSLRSVKGWVKGKSRNYDYGAIILPKNAVVPSSIGAFGFANYPTASLKNARLNTAGYPGDKPSGTMWFHGRKAKTVTARTLVYDIDTAGGQSGSAVFLKKDSKRIVVGIHTNGALSGNSATRITKPVFANLKRWRDEGK